MNPKTFYLLRGAPGAGKTYWCAINNFSAETVCSDAVRLHVAGTYNDKQGKQKISQRHQKEVWQEVAKELADAFDTGKPVILDATNVNRRDMEAQRKLANLKGYDDICVVDFSGVDERTCRYQNRLREEMRQVPDFVIEKYHAKLETETVPEDYRVLSPDDAAKEVKSKLEAYYRIKDVEEACENLDEGIPEMGEGLPFA